MLKQAASFVLAAVGDSTYLPVRVASSLAASLLDSLFEHPTCRPGVGVAHDITTAC
jgi:hypothetical protein